MTRRRQYKTAQRVGDWTLQEYLGSGGNAEVWRATREGRSVALKILRKRDIDSEPYKRFCQEIDALGALSDVPGVLPLLDYHLPDQPSRADPAWVAMPEATLLRATLDDATLLDVVVAVAAVVDTLARIADEHNIGHRDIKPDNLYVLNGTTLVGDFGLAAAPDGDDLTELGRSLGPRNFMPYEMLENAKGADPFPADVYSLAKTFYVLITGSRWPPQGEQRADSRAFDIAQYHAHPRTYELNRLIDACTRHAPEDRTTMRNVTDDLQAWLEVSDDEIEVPDISATAQRLREFAAPKLNERDLRNRLYRRGEELIALFGEEQRPLNDEVRRQYSPAEIAVHSNLAEQHFGTRFARNGIEKEYHNASGNRMVGPGPNPWILEIGTYLAVWVDEIVTVDVIIAIHPEFTFSGETWIQSWQAPAESLQADASVREAAAAIRTEFPKWLELFVDKLAAAT